LRGLSLLIVLATNEPVEGHSDYVFPPPVIEAARKVGRGRLDHAAMSIRNAHPNLDVRTVLDFTDPRRALVTRSTDTLLTVVGARGRGRLTEVLVGSVAFHVAAHAHSPVAVVPATVDGSGNGPILLGVGGGSSSAVPVGYAFEEAALRKAGVLAVLVEDDAERWLADEGRPPVRPTQDQVAAVLSRHLAPWREKYPDVPVREVVRRGRPAPQLLECLHDGPTVERPQLIVVGSRGRGGVAGLFLGSTSQRLIARTTVPVLVVRPDDEP